MKIIMPFGPTPRNDGGCLYIPKFLNKMPGVTCEYREVTVDPEAWGDYDALLYVDWGQDAFNLPDPRFPPGTPSVLWLSDTHMSEKSKANRFRWAVKAGETGGRTLFYHPDALQDYAKHIHLSPLPAAAWLPAAADHTVYTPPLPHDDPDRSNWPHDPDWIEPKTCRVIPQYDLGWVGHVGDPDREEFLDRMFREFPRFTMFSGLFFEDAARLFHLSAIVVNRSVRGDLNMRTFEALSSRSFLLSDYQKGMNDLGLQDGVHFAGYDSTDEAVDKARFYLSRPALRERIADAGWRWVLHGHTYAHRAETLLAQLQR